MQGLGCTVEVGLGFTQSNQGTSKKGAVLNLGRV